MHNTIYSPEEDSYLMSEFFGKIIPIWINENPDMSFFEVGAGSGINLKSIFDAGVKKQNIFSCDKNLEAVNHCRRLGFDNCVQSDLFNNIPKTKKFDVIIFNPPYLPEDENYSEPEDSKLMTTGGKDGNEVIIEFLKQAKNFLKEKGKIFLITSSLSKKVNFGDFGYFARLVKEKKLFFERLFLWELKHHIKVA